MNVPFLEWTDDHSVAHRHPVVDKVFIGRGCKGLARERCLLVQDAVVSRDHAVITRNGAALELIDMSKNGTWLNRVRVSPGGLVALKDGDEIEIGAMTIRVSYPAADSAPEESEQWEDATTITPTLTYVTHLVADVRGFSALAQIYDSNHAYTLMNDIIQVLSRIIQRFKGTIKDYAGDAVFAFWPHAGTPSREQVVLACRAAVEQANAIENMRTAVLGGDGHASPVRMGWGISTGHATISHYGDRTTDLAVVGDATNLAFRLSSMANKTLPAEIVLCSRTAEIVRDTLPVEDLGRVQTRGRTGREQVFALNPYSPDSAGKPRPTA